MDANVTHTEYLILAIDHLLEGCFGSEPIVIPNFLDKVDINPGCAWDSSNLYIP